MELTDRESRVIERLRKTPQQRQAEIDSIRRRVESRMTPEQRAERDRLAALPAGQRENELRIRQISDLLRSTGAEVLKEAKKILDARLAMQEVRR